VKRVLTAAILIPIVIVVLFRAPLWLFTLLVLGVALLAAREYFDIAEKTGFRPMRILGYLQVIWIVLALSASVGSTDFLQATELFAFLLVTPFVLFAVGFLIFGMKRQNLRETLPDAALSFMVLPYIGVPLALIVFQRTILGSGAILLLFLMVVVWSGDIAAYYVGRAIGKHKLAPRISPGKTWEGAIASTLFSMAIAWLLFHFAVPIQHGLDRLHLYGTVGWTFYGSVDSSPSFYRYHGSALWPLVFALCVNVAAQLGDLVESSIKRGAGLKDSGTLLPGHGGVLDRIDALLFALPVGWLFFEMKLQLLFG
jgi:phosphatidate cytidylyltransferase